LYISRRIKDERCRFFRVFHNVRSPLYPLQGNILTEGLPSIRYVRELERSLEKAEAALRANGINGIGEHARSDSQHKELQNHEAAEQLASQNIQMQDFRLPDNCSPTGSNRLALPQPNGHMNNAAAEPSTTEIMDVSRRTGSFEFHGQTSSMAFLERLMEIKGKYMNYQGHMPGPGSGQIISEFQKEASIEQQDPPRIMEMGLDDQYYPVYAFLFVDSYFKSLHYVNPIIDQDVFLKRCQVLWNGSGPTMCQSFKALYFAVLSLGALTRAWTEGSINGMDRWAWCSLLFEKAETLMRNSSVKNLETVQTASILAQVCQHQVDLNLAYTYLGIGVRQAFSTGINRLTQFRVKDFPVDSPTHVVSRTWWALYSLETELSLVLGRPDVLGPDCCHNRPPPPVDDSSENTIIPMMLGLSQILREISMNFYWDQVSILEKLQRAEKFEEILDSWLAQVPSKIQPTSSLEETSAVLVPGDHYWPKLQKLVLRLSEFL
jgi:hypothetical protein